MAAEVLADTGALLALLDRRDRWHTACVEALEQLPLPLVTTDAVLVELFYMVASRTHEIDAAWRLIGSGAIRLAPIGDDDLPALEALMRRYRDRPMDLADATLVHVADRELIETVFTVDHADFQTYRLHGRRRLRIVPARA